MGLISAALGAATGVLADQWKEYFYCEALPNNVLAVKGRKRASGRSSNRGSDNIISSGSVIAVADGQCMLIVEQGKIVDVCAEPGEYIYDSSTEPSIFSGKLGEGVLEVFKQIGKRFTFGGEVPKDHISIRCFGEYSFLLSNPLLFYTNVCGNVSADYTKEQLEGQMKTELLTALQPAFARISEMGIRYSALPGHTTELADALNEELSAKWRDLRGMEIASIGVSSVKASEEDEAMIKEMQRNAAFRNPNMAAAHLVGAQAAAMQAAASNTAAGPAMAFMGMNMAGQAGGADAASLFQMGQQQAAAPAAPAAGAWTCPSCGATATGKFCPECGAKKPEAAAGWTCPSCGTVNKGKFCAECGAKKPAGAIQYRCDKCGWEPEAGAKPPKFCPECGDPFDNDDIVG